MQGASQVAQLVKNLPPGAGDARDVGSMPGWRRSPGVGNGNPPQYSCLENPMDKGAWWATVHGVAKSWKWLSTRVCMHACTHTHTQSIHALELYPWEKNILKSNNNDNNYKNNYNVKSCVATTQDEKENLPSSTGCSRLLTLPSTPSTPPPGNTDLNLYLSFRCFSISCLPFILDLYLYSPKIYSSVLAAF